MASIKFKLSKTFLGDPWIRYSILLVFIYSSLFFLNAYYSEIIKLPYLSYLGETYPEFITKDDIELNKSFVEWFGVLYGFLLPLILVKAWEQFETLEKDFDKEADSLKVFIEDTMLLPSPLKDRKFKIVLTAIEYTRHIQARYIKESSNEDNAKKEGDTILNNLRSELSFFFDTTNPANGNSPLVSQLLGQLNVIIDVRGDRISNSKQRLFSGLRTVAISTSYAWLIPFYFLDYELGLYGDGLVFTVTALIVFVLHTIEDLDEPFYKKWRLDIDRWKDLENEFQSNLKSLL